MADEETTGTTEEPTGDAPEETTDSGSEAGRDAASEPDYKAMYLAAKEKVEEANRLAERVKELEGRQPESPAEEDDDDSLTEEELHGVRHWAGQDDKVARAALKLAKQNARLEKRLNDLEFATGTVYRASDIEDKALRREVLSHLNNNRHRLGDFEAAYAEVMAKKREDMLSEQGAELEKLREALKKSQGHKNDSEVVRTEARDVSATEVKAKKMTLAEFDAEQARIRQQSGPHAAMLFASRIGKDIELKQ
jgi:hypothetical protein